MPDIFPEIFLFQYIATIRQYHEVTTVHCRRHSTVLHLCTELFIKQRTVQLSENLQFIGHYAFRYLLAMQLICLRFTSWDGTDMDEADVLGCN